MSAESKSMSIIVTKGSLDWGYPPFILATTAAAMGLNVTMFFTFYGLSLLLKDFKPQISTLGNTAMKMPLAGMHMTMPNILGAVPGVDAAASMMLRNLIKKKETRRVGGVRVLETPWKPHKSKEGNFLEGSYTPIFFSTPKTNIFFRHFFGPKRSQNHSTWSDAVV